MQLGLRGTRTRGEAHAEGWWPSPAWGRGEASSTHTVAAKMEAVGAGRPIDVVDAGEMLALIELLEHWTRGATEVPDSVRELRGALRDALHNCRQTASFTHLVPPDPPARKLSPTCSRTGAGIEPESA
jgi:hypothetical protein